jgi:hypothetical protein
MIPTPSKSLPTAFLCLLIAACLSSHAAIGQQKPSEITAPNQSRPIPITHLYWHFLIWQSVLDSDAAQLNAEGKNGDRLRNDLQLKLGFSDADYAPIRTSSQRLASELKPLNDQIKAIGSTSFTNAARMRDLEAQRGADINSEVQMLRQQLSPQNTETFEAFLVKFFAPRPLPSKAAATSVQPTGEEVRK